MAFKRVLANTENLIFILKPITLVLMLKIRLFFVQILTFAIGRPLVFLQPSKAKKLGARGMTVVMGNSNLTPIERLMRRAILQRAERNMDLSKLANLHKSFWTNQGTQFFTYTKKRLEEVHLPYSEFMFNRLREQLISTGLTHFTLVEIGCGNGLVLNTLSAKIPEIKNFIGIDLSKEQIIANQAKYSNNKKLDFIAADAINWIDSYHHDNTVFLTFMGVYEYFPQDVLHIFFKKIFALKNSFIVAIEPNGIDHNLEKNPNSEIYGPESSFSHNYTALLEKTGFRVWWNTKKVIDDDENYISFIGASN